MGRTSADDTRTSPAPFATCLDKDLKRRQRGVGDARRDLELEAPPTQQKSDAGVARWRRRWLVVAATLAAVAGALGWWAAKASAPQPTSARSTLTRVTWHPGSSTEPALSPDGSIVVYASDIQGGGDLDLWAQRVGGGTPIQLTNNDVDDREPAFSPDGLSIAFRSERAGGGVYVMPALGGDARLIAPQGPRPRFSPDGTRITYWTGLWLGAREHREPRFS